MFLKKIISLNRFKSLDFVLFVFILLTGCAAKNKEVLETVSPPVLSKEYLAIPETINEPLLKKLNDPKQFISTVSIGRKNPFLPPDFKDKLKVKELLPPKTFFYHGYLNAQDSLNAFVTYQNLTGIIKPGDVGGVTTNFLPNGWKVENIDISSEVLSLSFDDNYLKIKLLDD